VFVLFAVIFICVMQSSHSFHFCLFCVSFSDCKRHFRVEFRISINSLKMSDSDSETVDYNQSIRDAWMAKLDRPRARAVIGNGESRDSISDVMGKLLAACTEDHLACQKKKFDAMFNLAQTWRRRNASLMLEFEEFVQGAFKFGYGGTLVKIEPV
jgi:hypothetical protein